MVAGFSTWGLSGTLSMLMHPAERITARRCGRFSCSRGSSARCISGHGVCQLLAPRRSGAEFRPSPVDIAQKFWRQTLNADTFEGDRVAGARAMILNHGIGA